ncbi:MAG: PAS domain-containing protein [Verrucomicrobiota bacterium]|nr:ATP-binding protein [Limisphaera sp.]MDW8382507.1 PAS domain-containing protein [Verrucomicrobiota bacterium]
MTPMQTKAAAGRETGHPDAKSRGGSPGAASGHTEPCVAGKPQPRTAAGDLGVNGIDFQLLAEAIPVGLFVCEEKRLLFTNEAFRNLWGRPVLGEEACSELASGLVETDRPGFLEAFPLAQDGSEGTVRYEGRLATGDETALRVEVYFRRLVVEGRCLVVGTVQDVTERRGWEERLATERSILRTLVDHLPVAIYLKDTAARKTLVNPVDQRNLGVQCEAEALGRTDFEFFPREQAEAFYADDLRVLTTGQPVLNREERITRPDGSQGWLLTSKVPLRDAQGRIVGLAGIGVDITERKRADEQVRLFAAQLERSNRELQDFAYVASHDLQEPLRKIVVFGERLVERYGSQLPPEARDYLERMRRAAQRMQTLINDLLAFSRVTTRARDFERVALRQVLEDVLSDLEARIEQTRAVITVEALPEIEADPLQIRQLFQNLLSNALKFRKPDQCPQIRVWAECFTGPRPDGGPDAPAESLCRVYVKDNGIGFDEKYLDRIFNVFQRLHGRGEYEGSGIGLAIARKIVLRHGGQITARSQPGEGATFIVTLPVHQPKPTHP